MTRYLSKIFFIFIAGIIISETANAQNSKAVELMNNDNFEKAAKILKMESDIKDINTKDLSLLGVCYVNLNNYKDAESVYKELIGRDKIDPENYFYYGELLLINDKYDKAKKFFKKYKEEKPQNEVAAELKIKACDFQKKWDRERTQVNVLNYREFNTEFDEKSVSEFKNKLICVSNRIPEKYRKDTVLSEVFSTGYLELKKGNIINESLLKDYSCDALDYSEKRNIAAYTLRSKKEYLYETTFKNAEIFFENFNTSNDSLIKFQWEDMPEDINIAHPAFAHNGERLFFVSNMKGGKGQSDIYYSDFKNGKWSTPQNVVKINTQFSEVFPVISGDTILYFSSDGYPGYGNLDIYKVRISGDNFGKPVNLKAPVNSLGNDFSFYHTGKYKGYLSSNRSVSTNGMNDVYTFNFPVPQKKEVEKEPEEEPKEEKPVVHKFDPESFRVEPVFFDLDSKNVDEVFSKEIKQVADTLSRYENYKIVLKGFADSKGPQNYSIDLAEKRCHKVKDILQKNGAAGSQIKIVNGGIKKQRNADGIKYHVQLGSSKRDDVANWYKEKLKHNEILKYKKGEYFIYAAGKFDSKKEARDFRDKVQKENGINGILICSSKGKLLSDCFYALNRRVEFSWEK